MAFSTKIKRYRLHKNIRRSINIKNEFNLIDDFYNDIKDYIFKNIEMTKVEEGGIEKCLQSRIQLILSCSLLRSLYLKKGMVAALNDNNFPSYYSILKCFLEVPAYLGYVFYLLDNEVDIHKILDEMRPLLVGNRKAGSLSVGNVKPIPIWKMFEKLDLVLKKWYGQSIEMKEQENVMYTYYGDICNFSHPNFNSNLPVHHLQKKGTKHDDLRFYKEELHCFYMPHFVSSIEIIKGMIHAIVGHPKIRNFDLLSNKNYKPKNLLVKKILYLKEKWKL